MSESILQSRLQETSVLARSAQQHMARLQSRIFESYQTALDKAELALELQQNFTTCQQAFHSGQQNEEKARAEMRALRSKFSTLAQVSSAPHAESVAMITTLPISEALMQEESYWLTESDR